MKRILKSMVAVAAVAGLFSCGTEYEKPTEGSQKGFALSFFKHVNATVKAGENVVVSPYSAGVALSMVAEGSEGETRVEFDNALNGCLFKAVDLGGNDTVVVKSANSVWVDDDFSIRNRYVDMLDLAAKYRGYTFYYNGPRSGASAPDHHHFQAIPDGLIPLVNDVDENGNELETTHYRSDIFYSKEGLREFVYSYVPAQSKETQNADPANPGIKMNFSHPFAAVSFHLGQSYRMTLHDITLTNIKYEGIYRFDEGWSVDFTVDGQTGKPKVGDLWIDIEKGIPTPINFHSPIGGPYLVAPQALDNESYLNVRYTRLDGATETKSVALNALGATKWEAGRHYVYTLGLGNNEEEILFQVKVEKWTVIDYKNEVDVE